MALDPTIILRGPELVQQNLQNAKMAQMTPLQVQGQQLENQQTQQNMEFSQKANPIKLQDAQLDQKIKMVRTLTQLVGASVDEPSFRNAVNTAKGLGINTAQYDNMTYAQFAPQKQQTLMSLMDADQQLNYQLKKQLGDSLIQSRGIMPLSMNPATGDITTNAYAQPAEPPQANLSGEDFLKTLPSQTAEQIKSLAEGRMQFPAGFALKSPYWQQMISAVSKYDPSFDAVNYGARAKTRSAFTSGKEAQSINALNTVFGHIGNLNDAIEGLHNTDMPWWNAIANPIATNTGFKGVSDFNAIKNSVAAELVRVWRGTGGSEGDIKERLSDLSDAKTPDQLRSVVNKLGGLLQSKIDALQDQYKRGMGTAAQDTSFYTPETQKVMGTIGLNSGTQAQPQQTQDQQTQAIPAPDQRKLGQTYDTPRGKMRWMGNGWIPAGQ